MKDQKNLGMKSFDTWFRDLMFSDVADTCLLRDVLRDSKQALWDAWQKRDPYGEFENKKEIQND